MLKSGECRAALIIFRFQAFEIGLSRFKSDLWSIQLTAFGLVRMHVGVLTYHSLWCSLVPLDHFLLLHHFPINVCFHRFSFLFSFPLLLRLIPFYVTIYQGFKKIWHD